MRLSPARRRRVAPTALAATLATCLTGSLLIAGAAPAQAATTAPATFHFGGSGFGHGVGMSQYGAMGMAKGGATASQILTHYYTGTTVAAVTDNQLLRVNILHAATSFTLGSQAAGTGGGTIQVTVNGLPHVLGTAANTWTVAVSGTLVSVKKNGVSIGSGTTVGIYWAGTRVPGSAGTAPTLALVNGKQYRYGNIDVRVIAGRLEVNNPVLIHDEYLRGISEMPSSWPAAALQAQVAASRSYAMVKYAAGIRSACYCHVYNSTADQVFAGWAKEAGSYGAQWRAAVTATEPSATTGWAVLYGGKPVQAYYFSSSGGRTQNSEDVWVAALPWARSVDDHWSLDPTINPTYADWGADRTQAQVAAAFGLADVVKVSLAARTLGGGVATATAWSSTGASASVSGETLRSRLALPATWLHRDFLRLAGATPSDTDVAVSRLAAPTGTTVVIVSGDAASLAEGVAAAPLAVRKGAPLLLATATGLPAATAAEITRRHATSAYLVGDATALGPQVVTALQALGVTAITRLAGADAAGTAAAVATAMQLPVGTRAAVVNAADPAGALAVSAAAARAGRPVLLVDTNSIPASTQSVLDALQPKAVTVVGSSSEVSDAVLAQLPIPARTYGVDAYDTSLAIGRAFAPLTGTSDVVLVSGGGDLTDALSATGLGRVMLLTTAAPMPGVTDWLQRQPGVHRVVVVGDTTAVPDSTLRVAELA